MLIADNRKDEHFELSLKGIFDKLRDKYGNKWQDLLENYLSSSAAGLLLAKLQIGTITG